MKQIWDKIKDFAIPLVAGLIIFPVKAIFEFRGIIYQSPRFNKNGNIEVKFSNRSADDLKNVVLSAYFSDTTRIIHNFKWGMFVDRTPTSDPSFKLSSEQYGQSLSNRAYRQIIIPKIDQGEYYLLIPISNKIIGKINNVNRIFTVLFRQEADKQNSLEIIPTRPYQFFYFAFFHPWLTSLILAVAALLIQVSIKKIKPKPKI